MQPSLIFIGRLGCLAGIVDADNVPAENPEGTFNGFPEPRKGGTEVLPLNTGSGVFEGALYLVLGTISLDIIF